MKTNGTGRTEQIEREIAATRSDMDHTLSELQGRFTPGQLLDQGLDYVRGSGANEYVHNLGHSVKSNPLPIALVGIGLAWLMASGRNHNGSADYSLDHSSDFSPDSRSRLSDAKDRLSTGAHDIKDRLSSGSQDMKDRVAAGKQGMKDRVGHARDSISGTMHSAAERVSRTRDGARQQVDRARHGFESMLREQPLALGAIGVALGALMAAAAPRTRAEDEVMGGKRDELMDQAREMGREQLDKAKDVAGEAASTVKEEAQRHGMGPSDNTFSDTSPKTPSSRPDEEPANSPLNPPPFAQRDFGQPGAGGL